MTKHVWYHIYVFLVIFKWLLVFQFGKNETCHMSYDLSCNHLKISQDNHRTPLITWFTWDKSRLSYDLSYDNWTFFHTGKNWNWFANFAFRIACHLSLKNHRQHSNSHPLINPEHPPLSLLTLTLSGFSLFLFLSRQFRNLQVVKVPAKQSSRAVQPMSLDNPTNGCWFEHSSFTSNNNIML